MQDKKEDVYNRVSIPQLVHHSSEELVWPNDTFEEKYQKETEYFFLTPWHVTSGSVYVI